MEPCFHILLTPQASTPQYGQAQSDNSSPTADELLDCVWPFCGVDASVDLSTRPKERHRGVFRIPSNNYDGAFLGK